MSKLGIDATVPFEAERARFVHSKPPLLKEYSVDNKGNEAENAEQRIIDFLSEMGPSFFYEISSNLQEFSFRTILISWGKLRGKKEIEQGMDGKYAIGIREHSVSK